MVRVEVSRNGNGFAFSLPEEERKRWPRGRPRVFVATEPSEAYYGLLELLSQEQMLAVSGILTGTSGRLESAQFSDHGVVVASVDVLRPG